MKLVIKLLLLIIAIVGAFTVSQPIGNKLDAVVTAQDKRVTLQNCDDEIIDNTGMTYGLGKCTYIVTKIGWPITVEKQYHFLAIEKPNVLYNFTIDEHAAENKEIEYVQLPVQLSDPDFLCSSKSCVFNSDNTFLAFCIMTVVALCSFLYINKKPSLKSK